MFRRTSKTRAFSLVELVIVVVIIGVIAAIAVPRISRGAKGAGEAALKGDLAGLRNAIDMYSAEHGGAFPGADGLEATLISQLTGKSTATGTVGTTAGVHIYGPYLRSGFPPVPVGPNVGATGVIMSNAATLTTAIAEATTSAGWVYNYTTGEIIVNTVATAEDGTTAYSSY